MGFNCEYFKSAVATFQSIRKGTDPRSKRETRGDGLSEVKRQRRINREDDERRRGR